MKAIIRLTLTHAVLLGATGLHASESAADWVTRGDRLMQDARNLVSHDFADAENAYRKALDLDPDHPQALLGMAWVKNSDHDFAKGEEWARKAIAVDPSLQHAYSLMGDGAIELGEYEKAFEHYQKALDLRSDLASLGRAANLLWLTGDAERGCALMAQAASMGGPYPENAAWCHAELANMQRMGGEIASAEASAEVAMKLAPENPRVLAAMGAVHMNQGRYDEAIECYEKSASITPMHLALAPLVDLYQLTGDEKKAAKQLDRVLDFHGSHHHGHGHSHGHSHHHENESFELAKFLADHDMRIPHAVHVAEHAFEDFPNIRVADALAWCHYKAGDLDEAQRMIGQALEHGTPDPEIHFHAGMIAAARHETEQAREHLSKALDLNPNFHPLHADEARGKLEELGSAPSALEQDEHQEGEE